MKKWKITIFSFLILLASFVLVAIVPCQEVKASDDFLVVFDYNSEALSDNLMDAYKNPGVVTSYVNSGECAVRPEVSSNSVVDKLKSYYTYEWTINGEVVDVESYVITKNTTFLAKWTPKEYKIIYKNLPYEKESDTYSIETGRFDYFRPEKEHYVFVDWCSTSYYNLWTVETYRRAGAIGDVVLYAHWRPIEYSINYNTDAENKYNPDYYNIESPNINLTSPVKEGYVFKGWYLDQEFTKPISTITTGSYGDLNLYPKWEAVTYKVTYTLPNGNKEVILCDYGKTAELPNIDKSIFEIVKTDVPRTNITGNTKITITLHNIWYVYLIGLIVIAGVIVLIVFAIKKNKEKHTRLRYLYHSNNKRKR